MKGYIALTTPEWLEFIQESGLNLAVYWRKRKKFKAVDSGENFYFLQKGHFDSNMDRYIVGRGIYISQEYIQACKAWGKYHTAMGYASKKEFLDAVFQIYREDNPYLSCLIINNIQFFEEPVSVGRAKIDLSPYTVSGKTIFQDECAKIDKFGGIS